MSSRFIGSERESNYVELDGGSMHQFNGVRSFYFLSLTRYLMDYVK